MVEFESTNGHIVYVNPKNVTHVKWGHRAGVVLICFNGDSILVKGDIELIAEDLSV